MILALPDTSEAEDLLKRTAMTIADMMATTVQRIWNAAGLRTLAVPLAPLP